MDNNLTQRLGTVVSALDPLCSRFPLRPLSFAYSVASKPKLPSIYPRKQRAFSKRIRHIQDPTDVWNYELTAEERNEKKARWQNITDQLYFETNVLPQLLRTRALDESVQSPFSVDDLYEADFWMDPSWCRAQSVKRERRRRQRTRPCAILTLVAFVTVLFVAATWFCLHTSADVPTADSISQTSTAPLVAHHQIQVYPQDFILLGMTMVSLSPVSLDGESIFVFPTNLSLIGNTMVEIVPVVLSKTNSIAVSVLTPVTRPCGSSAPLTHHTHVQDSNGYTREEAADDRPTAVGSVAALDVERNSDATWHFPLSPRDLHRVHPRQRPKPPWCCRNMLEPSVRSRWNHHTSRFLVACKLVRKHRRRRPKEKPPWHCRNLVEPSVRSRWNHHTSRLQDRPQAPRFLCGWPGRPPDHDLPRSSWN